MLWLSAAKLASFLLVAPSHNLCKAYLCVFEELQAAERLVGMVAVRSTQATQQRGGRQFDFCCEPAGTVRLAGSGKNRPVVVQCKSGEVEASVLKPASPKWVSNDIDKKKLLPIPLRIPFVRRLTHTNQEKTERN
eukprot:TRINITY_DN20565_c0_g2_i1.p1 TRINITY_DN20565_c0_g2~~TRINITY_DN20565_c0_g2_i1.p1  ORF type:complete len:135 (-),score=15.41 TRINITY_DN20565_c0_g2_i1:2-406(-)